MSGSQTISLSQVLGNSNITDGQIVMANVANANSGGTLNTAPSLVYFVGNNSLGVNVSSASAVNAGVQIISAVDNAIRLHGRDSNRATYIEYFNGPLVAARRAWVGFGVTSSNVFSISNETAGDTTFQMGSGDAACLRLTTTGNVILSNAAAGTYIPTYFGGQPGIFSAANGNQSFLSFWRFEAGTGFGTSLSLGKSRSNTIGTLSAAQQGDNPGDFLFLATDGTNIIPCARIIATHSGAVSTNTTPTQISLQTAVSNVCIDQLIIDHNGQLLTGGAASITDANGLNHQITMRFPGGGTRFGLGMRANANATQMITFVNAGNQQVGTINITTTVTNYVTSSDYRLKSNVVDLVDGLKTTMKLTPRRFDWYDGSPGVGFIAHELQEHVPEAVTGAKDGVDANGNMLVQGVDLAKVVPHLVIAIQELKAEIEDLKKKIK